MPIPSLAVANFFVEKSIDGGVELTPMKLIKLVYIAHGWHLAINKEPLISEAVQAWKYGPVVRSVYDQFKGFRDGQVTQMAQVFANGEFIAPRVSDDNTKAFLQSVWSAYCHFSGWQLSAITHEPNTPWDKTWNANGGSDQTGAVIPNETILQHYVSLRERRSAATGQS